MAVFEQSSVSQSRLPDSPDTTKAGGFENSGRCERTFNRRCLPTPRDAMPRVKHSWHSEVAVGTRNGKKEKEQQKETDCRIAKPRTYLEFRETTRAILFPHLFSRVAREIWGGKSWKASSLVSLLSLRCSWLVTQAKSKEKRNYETQRNWRIWTGARGYSVPLYESLLHPDADWARPKGRAMVERRARRTNLMGMQCGNFKLDLFLLLFFSSVLFSHPQSLPSRRLQHRDAST